MTTQANNHRPSRSADLFPEPKVTRRFDPDRPLAETVVDALIDRASRVISAFHLQPTRFVVVRDPRNRRKLRRCAFGAARLTEAPVVLLVLAYLRPHWTDLETVAGRLIASGQFTPDQAARFRAEARRALGQSSDLAPEIWAIREATRAATTLLLAAEWEGIGSAVVETFDPAQIREAFGVPDDHAIWGLIALGHAAEVDPVPDRFPLDQVRFDEHFGQPWEPSQDLRPALDSLPPPG